ncbi:MAG: hypothetical protein P9L92_00605 [Candidatus Electryonea clarkiae]|nr:hypothetical protein [Candidatus Electryonea clarkiae]MDP8287079.1 hypothetical protein [Candidatus Electryonea clarkiae]
MMESSSCADPVVPTGLDILFVRCHSERSEESQVFESQPALLKVEILHYVQND